MKEFVMGAAAIIAVGAGAAWAQAPATPRAPQIAPMAPMADRVTTRAEVVTKIRDHFARLDSNRDGFLTKEEAQAGRQIIKQRLAERGENRLQRRDPKVAFDRLDANKDGAISREEFEKGHELRIERRMVIKDGAAGHAGGAHKGMRMHRLGGMMLGGHMFDMADANKDGRVSLQEATDSAVRHFDMADANRDGQVTPDERRQMHRQMIEKHRGQKAG
jgi:hypothetical protein